MKGSTIALISVGTIVAGFTAYAVYFDYRRRNDPSFRQVLKREGRRHERHQREALQKESEKETQMIRDLLAEAKEEGFPTSREDKEQYFLVQIQNGEALTQGGDPSNYVEAALSFWRALKVYPESGELMQIFNNTVPAGCLDVLAKMIALDPAISITPSGRARSAGPRGGPPPPPLLD